MSDAIEPGRGKFQLRLCTGRFYLGLGKPWLSWIKWSRRGMASPRANGFWIFYGMQIGGGGEIRAPKKSKVGLAKALGQLEKITALDSA